jgi:hypothetical protein
MFSTIIEHDFYVDGLSHDLIITPTIETADAMKNSNMQFRLDGEGFRVLYRVDDQGASFIPFQNVQLVFAVQLNNPAKFLNITELTGYAQGKVAYYNNISSETATPLNSSFIDYLRPSAFNYEFPDKATLPNQTGQIIVTDEAGNPVTLSNPLPNNIPHDSENRFFYPIDFSGMPKGYYTFQTIITPSGPTTSKTVYIDNNLAKGGIFGIIHINVIDGSDGSFPPPPPPGTNIARTYSIHYLFRETTWKYIVVLKSFDPSQPVPAIGIVDNNPSQPVYGTLSFNASTDTTVNGVAAKIITTTSNMIPFYEAPKKGLTVVKDPNTISQTDLVSDIAGVSPDLVSPQKLPVKDLSITEIFVYI